MGLIISEDEANARLSNPDNLANRLGGSSNRIQDSYNKPRENGPNNDDDQLVSIRPVHNGGRRPGDDNVPELVRGLAAVLTQSGETSREVAQALGLSKSAVDQYKEGNTSFGRPNAQLRSVLRENMDAIQEKAIKKMLKGVDWMDFEDEEKMKKVSYRDMSAILLNLSKLVSDPGEDEKRDSTRLIVYSPTVKTEHHFNIVEVRGE